MAGAVSGACSPQDAWPRIGCSASGFTTPADSASAALPWPAASTTSSACASSWPAASSTCHWSACRSNRHASDWPRHVTPGVASHACTRFAGLIQPARTCHKAGVLGGRPQCLSCSAVASVVQSCAASASACPACHAAGGLRACSMQCSSTPVAHQSMPVCSRESACCSITRIPLRDRRDSTLSSGETCAANTPAGNPDAPAAGVLAASITVTCQPRRAKLAATAAPARPAPTTTQRAGVDRCSVVDFLLGSHAGWYSPCKLSRLGAMPETFFTTKPHCANASRTLRATVQVARRVPRRQQRATALKVCTSQISGFSRGLKPSR